MPDIEELKRALMERANLAERVPQLGGLLDQAGGAEGLAGRLGGLFGRKDGLTPRRPGHEGPSARPSCGCGLFDQNGDRANAPTRVPDLV